LHCPAQKVIVKNVIDSTKKTETVLVSCGQCQFKLKTQKGCDLAVKINDKAYFIDGVNIDDFGDAHAKDGFCEAIKKAEVQGKIVKGRYLISYIKIMN
jgi:hypothetical protein